jgi:hypothetical protein
MDEIDSFVNEENIARFSDRLYSERNPEKQHMLRRLLLEEEHRFGLCVSQMEMAQRYIGEGAARIEKQKTLISKMKSDGNNITEENRVLKNLEDIQNLFINFFDCVSAALDRNKL